MNLDKLRNLIDTYNPASSRRTAESMDAHHELALLAHYLLLPMAEALLKQKHEREFQAQTHACHCGECAYCLGCAVLASLEEALL